MSLNHRFVSRSISTSVPEALVDLADTHPYHLSTFLEIIPPLKFSQLGAICANGITVSIGVGVGVAVGVLVTVGVVVGVFVAVGSSARSIRPPSNHSSTPEKKPTVVLSTVPKKRTLVSTEKLAASELFEI